MMPQQETDTKLRRCLGWCGNEFMSTWAGHRVCSRCASRAKLLNPEGVAARLHVLNVKENSVYVYGQGSNR